MMTSLKRWSTGILHKPVAFELAFEKTEYFIHLSTFFPIEIRADWKLIKVLNKA